MPLESAVMHAWTDETLNTYGNGYARALEDLFDQIEGDQTNPYFSAVAQIGAPPNYNSYPAPADAFAAMEARIAGLADAVALLAPNTAWSEIYSTLVSQLASNSTAAPLWNGEQVTHSSIVAALTDTALKESYKTLISAVVGTDQYEDFTSVAKTLSETMADSVSSKGVSNIAANAGALDDASFGASTVLTGQARTKSNEYLTSVLADASIIGAIADSRAMLSSVHNIEITPLQQTIASISVELVPLIDAAFTNALTAANTALAGAPITAMVDAFEDDILPTHMRSVNRVAAGFSDINAVNSSAFAFGMVMLEDGFQKQVSKFRADAKLQIFNSLFPLYIKSYVDSLTQDLQIIVGAIQARIDTVDRQLNKRLELFVNGFNEHLKASLLTLSELSQTQRTTMASQGHVYQSFLVAQLDSLKTSMSSHVAGFLSERATQKNYRNAMLSQSITETQQQYLNRLQGMREVTALQTEIARISHGAYIENWKLNENYVTESRIWPWKKWQYLDNAVAAAGSGTMVPDKPSNAASIIAGIMMGGEMGAKIGGQITWNEGKSNAGGWGALAGAILGGFGGDQ